MYSKIIAALAICLAPAALTAQTLKFDFGVVTQQSKNAAWNQVSGNAGKAPGSIPVGSVVSTTGPTPYGLDATGFGNGPTHGTSGGGANWDGPYPIRGAGVEGGAPGSDMALKDGLFARSGAVPFMTLTNLPPGSVWNFLFYGARGNNGGNADFTVTGTNKGAASITDVFKNTAGTAAIPGIIVPASGVVTFTLSGGKDAPAAALNAMIVTRSGWTYGIGCAGSNGIPGIEFTGSARPGMTLGVDMYNAAVMAPAFLNLGFLNTAPFPIDLSGLGAPGCMMYNDVAAGLGGGANAAGEISFSFAIPTSAGIVGLKLFMQGLSIDAGANAMNLTTSNGGVVVINN